MAERSLSCRALVSAGCRTDAAVAIRVVCMCHGECARAQVTLMQYSSSGPRVFLLEGVAKSYLCYMSGL